MLDSAKSTIILIGWAFSEFCATLFYTDVKVEKLYYLQGLRVRGQEGVQRDGRRQQGDYLHEEEVFPILSEPHYLILVAGQNHSFRGRASLSGQSPSPPPPHR